MLRANISIRSHYPLIFVGFKSVRVNGMYLALTTPKTFLVRPSYTHQYGGRGVRFVADDQNNQPLGNQTLGAANGKDVLYGWLVGRAAADLGLAQAIAANEAQRAEQIKRLEEALLGQMHELQNSQAAAFGSAADGAEVNWLKHQVQQFGERQNLLEAQQLTIGQLEGQLSAKIAELEGQIEQPPAAAAIAEISALRAEIAGLTQRLAQAEAHATCESATVDCRLLDEQIAATVREQTEVLKTQLFEQFQSKDSVACEFKALETSFQQKLDAMQQEIREKAGLLRLRDAELSDLRQQLAAMAQRLDQVAATPLPEASVNEREAERAQWQRDFDERLTSRLRELGDEIRGKLHGFTNAKVDEEQFRAETAALTARIAQLEQSHEEANSGAAAEARSAYQAAVDLRGEIAELKSAVLEQQRARSNDAMVHEMEKILRPKIQELHSQIGHNQRATLEWENRFNELRGNIQTLMQRQIQSEAVAKQSQASVTQEMAQIRGSLTGDLLAIEAQLNERRSHDASLQGLEESLNLRLRELHNQLSQGTFALEQRDTELRDVKDQVRLLAQRINQSSQYAPNRFEFVAASSAPPLSGAGVGSQPANLQPVASDGSSDSLPNLFQPVAAGNRPTSDQTKISVIDLHDRLSADIERKRAELREKSGRWKVRQ
jgi:chromosome segregation ATPase